MVTIHRIDDCPGLEEGMTISVGVDLHKTQFTVAARGAETLHGRYATTKEGYAAFLGQLERLRKRGAEVRLAVESTGNARYFKRQMAQQGYPVFVINSLKFKVINESVKKTDRHDAATIAEFLEKDMLPEAWLCDEKTEGLRRLLKTRSALVRARVTIQNQIHGMLVSLGMEDKKAGLQSKRGRQEILDALNSAGYGLEVHALIETIDILNERVKMLEQQIAKKVREDRDVQLLRTIPGCGLITASTIRAYTDDIRRFVSYKQYAAYAGLVPWVQSSNETVHYGRITKRGPEALRTAFVQLVLGMVRNRNKTGTYRLMHDYKALKESKSSGKAIIATARKLAKIVWYMLTNGKEFDPIYMRDRRIWEKADAMRTSIEQSA
jgi:transposase